MRTERSIEIAGSVIAILVGACVLSVSAQPGRGKATKPTRAGMAQKVSPAEALYREGLKCGAKDYDCQIAAYTKAINLKLNTSAVFKERGTAYLAQTEFAKAVKDLRKANTLDPNVAGIHKSLAQIFLTLGEPGLAIQSLTSAAELEPKDIEIYKQRSTLYSLTGNQDKAIEDISKVINLTPTDAGLYESRAAMYIDKRAFDKAIADYTRLISLKPDNVDYYIKRAQLYRATKHEDAALQDYSRIIELRPSDSTYLARAAVYFDQKNYDKAFDDYAKALAAQPKAWDAYLLRGNAYLTQKLYDNAIQDFSLVISERPELIDAYMARGKAYKAKATASDKNYGRAIEDFSKIIALDPNFALAFRERAFTYHLAGDSNKHKEDYAAYRTLELKRLDPLVAANPKDVDLLLERAKAQLTIGKANDDLTAAIRLDPKCIECFKERISMRLSAEIPNSIEDLNALVDLEPQANHFWLRGVHYRKLKQYERALADYTAALQKSTTAKDKAFYHYQRGLVLFEDQKDYANANEDFLKAIDHMPEDPLYYGWAAGSFRRLNRTAEALDFMTKAITTYPTSPALYRYRGNIYFFDLKDKKRAKEDYLKCSSFRNGEDSEYCNAKLAEL